VIKQRGPGDGDWNEVEIVAYHVMTGQVVIKRKDNELFPCGDPFRTRHATSLLDDSNGDEICEVIDKLEGVMK